MTWSPQSRESDTRGTIRKTATIIAACIVFPFWGIVFLALIHVIFKTLAGDNDRPSLKLATEVELELIRNRLFFYSEDMGEYPAESEWAEAVLGWGDGPHAKGKMNPPSFDGPIKNDAWGNPYQYRRFGPESSHPYQLWSYGPDGEDGTGDEIHAPVEVGGEPASLPPGDGTEKGSGQAG